MLILLLSTTLAVSCYIRRDLPSGPYANTCPWGYEYNDCRARGYDIDWNGASLVSQPCGAQLLGMDANCFNVDTYEVTYAGDSEHKCTTAYITDCGDGTSCAAADITYCILGTSRQYLTSSTCSAGVCSFTNLGTCCSSSNDCKGVYPPGCEPRICTETIARSTALGGVFAVPLDCLGVSLPDEVIADANRNCQSTYPFCYTLPSDEWVVPTCTSNQCLRNVDASRCCYDYQCSTRTSGCSFELVSIDPVIYAWVEDNTPPFEANCTWSAPCSPIKGLCSVTAHDCNSHYETDSGDDPSHAGYAWLTTSSWDGCNFLSGDDVCVSSSQLREYYLYKYPEAEGDAWELKSKYYSTGCIGDTYKSVSCADGVATMTDVPGRCCVDGLEYECCNDNQCVDGWACDLGSHNCVPSADWPVHRSNNQRTGSISSQGPYNDLVALWKLDLRDDLAYVYNPPVVWKDYFVIAGYKTVGGAVSKIFVVNASNGTIMWQKSFSNKYIQQSPAVYNNTIFVTANNFLYAFDLRTGSNLWEKDTVCFFTSSPAFFRDWYMYFTKGQYFERIVQSSGALTTKNLNVNMWPTIYQGVSYVSPTLSGRKVYFYSANYSSDGQHFGKYLSFPWSLSATPTVYNVAGSLLSSGFAFQPFVTAIGSAGKTSFVFDRGLRKDYTTTLSPFSAGLVAAPRQYGPAQAGGYVYVNARGILKKLTGTGSTVWSYSMQTPSEMAVSSPAVAGSHVYGANYTNGAFVLADADGSVEWSASLPEFGNNLEPIAGGKRVYYASTNGVVYALMQKQDVISDYTGFNFRCDVEDGCYVLCNGSFCPWMYQPQVRYWIDGVESAASFSQAGKPANVTFLVEVLGAPAEGIKVEFVEKNGFLPFSFPQYSAALVENEAVGRAYTGADGVVSVALTPTGGPTSYVANDKYSVVFRVYDESDVLLEEHSISVGSREVNPNAPDQDLALPNENSVLYFNDRVYDMYTKIGGRAGGQVQSGAVTIGGSSTDPSAPIMVGVPVTLSFSVGELSSGLPTYDCACAKFDGDASTCNRLIEKGTCSAYSAGKCVKDPSQCRDADGDSSLCSALSEELKHAGSLGCSYREPDCVSEAEQCTVVPGGKTIVPVQGASVVIEEENGFQMWAMPQYGDTLLKNVGRARVVTSADGSAVIVFTATGGPSLGDSYFESVFGPHVLRLNVYDDLGSEVYSKTFSVQQFDSASAPSGTAQQNWGETLYSNDYVYRAFQAVRDWVSYS
ncbi:MAG: PQQ-binding-like beta-propeller repeat protein [Candidatus Diapherotrites archaeon]|nr:PQQ-binding-like beta-propeller repeat protein [Candidatus Diapherotrites archaeon]